MRARGSADGVLRTSGIKRSLGAVAIHVLPERTRVCYLRSQVGSTTKRIFAFHNFVEKIIGLFGCAAATPPPNADSIE